MSILNRPSDGLLSVLLVLRRALVAYGPTSREQLLALCAPPGAVSQESPPSKMMIWKTLHRWLQLGLFREDQGTVTVAPPFDRIGLDDLETMRTAVFALLLRPENNRTLVGAGGEDQDEASAAGDFTRAAAWALSQDPYAFSELTEPDDAVRRPREQQVAPDIFTNDTRWQGFKEWAPFAGIALMVDGRLILNPARAIREVLPSVWSSETRLPIAEFLHRLCAAVPVLDSGEYRTIVDAQVARPWRTASEQDVSPCTSLALLQLRHEGLLRLENLADSPKRSTLLGRRGRALGAVTHVARETV